MSTIASSFDVLEFWWDAGPQKWWSRDDAFDREIRARFEATHIAAAGGGLDAWGETPDGAMALTIVLDQFSRNLHRESSDAFAHDATALVLARASIERGFHRAFPSPARCFFALPLMHAEDMAAQEEAVDFCRLHGDAENYKAALEHLDIIRRFGRFPHRNAVLGRETTDAEWRFLDTGGFKG
ncbi:MAG: DUF924 family protein [Pseudomonadota bacterium]